MSWTITGQGKTLGLLDSYGGAAAAYSLRTLSLYYSGPVVRVRRSSDNTEQDFTATQITDGTLTTFCGTGNGFVQTWYDQSGNGVHANNATTGEQPTIVSSGALITVNTKPAIAFANKLLVSSPTLPAAPQSLTFVIVHNANGNPGIGQASISFSVSSTRSGGIIIQQNIGLQPCSNPKPAYPTAQSLIFYVQNTTADFLRLDGTLRATSLVSNSANIYLGNFNIGRRANGNLYMNHFSQEIIIFPFSQSVNVEADINAYYSIY